MTLGSRQALTILVCVGASACFVSPMMVRAEDKPAKSGLFLGKVYEFDSAKYEEYVDRLRRENRDINDPDNYGNWDDYLDERSDVLVTATEVKRNLSFVSHSTTNDDGDYVIRKTPIGVFEFSLTEDDVDYPVHGWLDVTVQLTYVTEVCFALDRERHTAWMIRPDNRLTKDAPAWLPFECRSVLRACLAPFMTPGKPLPRELLVIAGSLATATALGVTGATDQVEASPPQER